MQGVKIKKNKKKFRNQKKIAQSSGNKLYEFLWVEIITDPSTIFCRHEKLILKLEIIQMEKKVPSYNLNLEKKNLLIYVKKMF